jgi:LAS superfamily LD-carboxypeptidase LdcB
VADWNKHLAILKKRNRKVFIMLKRNTVIWLGRMSAIGISVALIAAFKIKLHNLQEGLKQSCTVEYETTEELTDNHLNGTDVEEIGEENYGEYVVEEIPWYLTLVNPWNTLPDGWSISTVELVNGQSVDDRCYMDLQAMMDDCRAEGLLPYICSSYRTWDKQNQLFEETVEDFLKQGYSEEQARIETAKVVARPGTSEHQLGLAVDIVDKNYQVLDEAQEDTEVQQWLMDNSWRYGWILRYPTEKSDVTGIIYEPWHYRYVGKEAAEEIYHQGICLEEYLEKR